MQQTQLKRKAQEIVELDAADIYLGNLNRVEADIDLPAIGKRGSKINWHSGEILFLSHSGKITRPTNGVGNRKVSLYATLAYEDAVLEKQFDMVVIEEPKLAKIVLIHPVHITILENEAPALPPVVIADLENGESTTAPVTWEPFKLEGTGNEVTVHGTVEGTDLNALAMVQLTADPETAHPHLNRSRLVNPFDASDITLAQGSAFWDSQNAFLQHLLTVNDDQMLYNFRVAAHLDTLDAPPMTGWDAPECNLKGHTTGHYLSALALAYSSSGNAEIKKKLDYMIHELAKCQDALSAMSDCHEGFLSAYSEEQFNLLEKFATYPTIWAPYYTLHKIMAGLLDAYRSAKNKEALRICARLGDWVYNRLSVLPQEQLDRMWSMYIAGEFGGMIEALVDLYSVTQTERYLTAAKFFRNEKLYYPMAEGVDTLEDMHANQHIPQIIGAMKLFEAEKEPKYYHISENFWNMVTKDHTYCIGGTGENEMFKRAGKIGSCLTEKTAESCATYNMLKLTKELYLYAPDKRYMDYYEQALYNHILSTCNKQEETGGTTYFMPLSPGSQKVFQTTENTCCHGTGLENHFKYKDAIYFHDADTLYVNLYIPSSVKWNKKGVALEQTCEDTRPGNVSMKIFGSGSFTLKLRKPTWITGDATIRINGKKVETVTEGNGYYTLTQDWANDTIEISMAPAFRVNRTPDCPELCSISYGPYTLAALSDATDFLILHVDEKTIAEQAVQTDTALHFELEGIPFLPLNQITHQHYHGYFKLAEKA